MTLRSLLAVALLAPVAAAAAPAAAPAAPATAPAADAAAVTSPSDAAEPGTRRRTAAVKKRLRARTPAGERSAAAAPRVVAASAVMRPSPALPRERPVARGAPRSSLELGAFAGYEADNVSGVSVRLDAALPVTELGPRVSLAAVASAAYARLSDTFGFLELEADVFKLVPSARLGVPLGSRFSLFADVGFGVAYVSARLASNNPAVVKVSAPSDRSLNAMMRLGAGAMYHLTRWLKVGAMAEVDPIFGDFAYAGAATQTTFLVQGGMMFRL